MPKTSVPDIQKVPIFRGKSAPRPLLYHAPKDIILLHYNAKKHKSIHVPNWTLFSLGKSNKIQLVIFSLSSLSFFLYLSFILFFLEGGVGGGSSKLIWATRGHCPKHFLWRGGHHNRSYLSNPTSPRSPIKNERSLNSHNWPIVGYT